MALEPRRRAARVYVDFNEVNERLAALGLLRSWLVTAARQGDLDRKLASPLDFHGRAEYDAASRGLRTLCEEATAAGWHRADYLGIPVMFNNDESIALTVTGGDKYTGMLGDEDPTSKSLKGPATVRATRKQKIPFGHAMGDEDEVGVSFWYLLTHADDKLRVELSSPLIVNDRGHVSGWSERIIVGSADGSESVTRRTVPSEPTPALDIQVRRRAG